MWIQYNMKINHTMNEVNNAYSLLGKAADPELSRMTQVFLGN